MSNIHNHSIYKKGLKIELTASFNSLEFDCNCTNPRCHYTLINMVLLQSLDNFRVSCGNRPLTITSAFRCQSWNIQSLGVKASFHTIGNAVDLIPPRKMPLSEFAFRARAFFDVVLIYPRKGFIHCHLT